MKHILLFFAITFTTAIQSQDLYFPPLLGSQWDSLQMEDIGWCADKADDLNNFLGETNSKAFIVLKDGKRVIEYYYDDFQSTDIWYWASAGKTMTSFLTGLAQEQGLLEIGDPTSMYLGQGWTSCAQEQEMEITIRHQLTMTTGLDYTVADPFCLSPECLICLNEPGTEWFYHNAPYTQISNVLEAASGETYTNYTNAQVALKIGFIGLWTFTNDTRLFWSKPRDMARFGLLMLNKGNWNGNQIMSDMDYYNAMITSSQDINPSYGYLWWLNGYESFRLPGTTIDFGGELIPSAPSDLYAAVGKNGQILMVIPSENLVIVRMGDNPDQSLVPIEYVRDLWDQIAQVRCTTGINEFMEFPFSIFPNPTSEMLQISTTTFIRLVEIYDSAGNLLLQSNSTKVEIDQLPSGIYFVRVSGDESTGVQKFIKL